MSRFQHRSMATATPCSVCASSDAPRRTSARVSIQTRRAREGRTLPHGVVSLCRCLWVNCRGRAGEYIEGSGAGLFAGSRARVSAKGAGRVYVGAREGIHADVYIAGGGGALPLDMALQPHTTLPYHSSRAGRVAQSFNRSTSPQSSTPPHPLHPRPPAPPQKRL